MAKKSLLAALGLAVIGALSPNLAHAGGQKESVPIVKTEAEQRTEKDANEMQKLQDYFDNKPNPQSIIIPTQNPLPVENQTKQIGGLEDIFNTTTMDFMFVGDYLHPLNRNEITDINALIKGGDSRQGVKPKIYAIDPSIAFQNKIKSLNSQEGKNFYDSKGQKNQRLYLIGKFQKFLNELKRQNISPSAKSLEALTVALNDGTLKPEELQNVEDNLYCLIKEGYDAKEGNYSVLYLANLTSETTPAQYQEKIRQLEEALKYTLSNLPGRALTPEEKEAQKLTQEIQERKQKQKKKERDYRGIYLQSQQTINGDLNYPTTSLGVRFNPFKEVDIGFGANIDLGLGFDEQTHSYAGQLSAGRTANGTITDTGKFSVGGSLEAQFGPLLIGGGIDYKNWIQNVVEQILDSSGNIIKSNTNSVPNRQIFGKVYTGVELPVGDAMRLGMIAGYNMKDGAYAGFRAGLKLK